MDTHLMKVRDLQAREALVARIEAMDAKLDAILAAVKPQEPASSPEPPRGARKG